jgi:hypothetical protein
MYFQGKAKNRTMVIWGDEYYQPAIFYLTPLPGQEENIHSPGDCSFPLVQDLVTDHLLYNI